MNGGQGIALGLFIGFLLILALSGWLMWYSAMDNALRLVEEKQECQQQFQEYQEEVNELIEYCEELETNYATCVESEEGSSDLERRANILKSIASVLTTFII